MPRRREPRPFAPAIQRLGEQLRPRTLLAEVQSVWDEVVGQAFAGSVPVREADGVVTVAAGSAAVAHRLDLMRTPVVEALNRRLGRAAVTDLRVRSTPPPS